MGGPTRILGTLEVEGKMMMPRPHSYIQLAESRTQDPSFNKVKRMQMQGYRIKGYRGQRTQDTLVNLIRASLQLDPHVLCIAHARSKRTCAMHSTCETEYTCAIAPWALPMGPVPWALSHGPCPMGPAHGPCPMGPGPWALSHGPCPMGPVPWALPHGPCPMGPAPWACAMHSVSVINPLPQFS